MKKIPNKSKGGIFYSTKLSLAIQYTIKIEAVATHILAANEKIEFTDSFYLQIFDL